MNPKRIAAIVLRQFYLIRSSPARVCPMFIWVAVDMVLWGFMTKYLNGLSLGKYDFVPLLLGAVLFWDFFSRIMFGVTMAFFEDVWSRNFLNIFATPLLLSEYVLGLVITSMLTSSIGLCVMLAISTFVFGLSFFVYGALLLPFILVLFLFGTALGVLGCAIVLRLGPASEWFIWPLPVLLSPFAAVYYPLSTLPQWMQWLSCLLPPSYIFEGMRAIVSGAGFELSSLALGGALSLLYVICAFWVFSRVYSKATRSGLIARYSAESIG